VIVVPDIVPVTVVLPRTELLITTSASFAPWRSASVAPTIWAVIESPTCTCQWVWLNAGPVCGSPPVGASRLPGPWLFAAGAAAWARNRAENTIVAPMSHAIAFGPPFFARASLRLDAVPHLFIAAVPLTP
jgi:hypothetical protein